MPTMLQFLYRSAFCLTQEQGREDVVVEVGMILACPFTVRAEIHLTHHGLHTNLLACNKYIIISSLLLDRGEQEP